MKYFPTIFIVFFSNLVFADSVKLDLVFDKKPPKAGLFYVVSDTPTGRSDELDQVDKKFTKKLVIADTKGSIVFNNTDGVDHNIFVNDSDAGVQFDVGLMPTGNTVKKTVYWKENTMVRIGCKIHPRMKAYIANVNSSNIKELKLTKNKKEYSIELENIKASDKKVALLFPGYDYIEVALGSGEEKKVKIIKRGKERGYASFSRK